MLRAAVVHDARLALVDVVVAVALDLENPKRVDHLASSALDRVPRRQRVLGDLAEELPAHQVVVLVVKGLAPLGRVHARGRLLERRVVALEARRSKRVPGTSGIELGREGGRHNGHGECKSKAREPRVGHGIYRARTASSGKRRRATAAAEHLIGDGHRASDRLEIVILDELGASTREFCVPLLPRQQRCQRRCHGCGLGRRGGQAHEVTHHAGEAGIHLR